MAINMLNFRHILKAGPKAPLTYTRRTQKLAELQPESFVLSAAPKATQRRHLIVCSHVKIFTCNFTIIDVHSPTLILCFIFQDANELFRQIANMNTAGKYTKDLVP